MPRVSEWIRNDLHKANKPGEIVHTVRTFPAIPLRVALSFVLALLAIYVVLALFGNADAFGQWWWLAALWAGSRGGSLVSQRKADARRKPSHDH